MNGIQSYDKAVSAVTDVEISDFGTLRPTTSQWTERYDRKQLASPKQVLITPGYLYCSEPEPQYLPPGWSPYTHPEGQLYFFRNTPLRIVTESYLYDSQTLTKALHWSKHIESILEDKQIPLSQHIELFIYIEDDGCSYYLVNHATQTQFWLEEVDTSELGLSDLDSDSHLRLALTELYWAHVEYFPMHSGGLPAKVVDDLICVLSHALTEECRQLLDVVKVARDRSTDGHQVCAMARIWRTIFRNRVETHYGQEIARLSRDQPIIYDNTKPTRVFEVANLLTFKTAGRYHAKLPTFSSTACLH
ncbi:hypothetical protein MPER_11083 [Moniliophthora perniciosa FA553]|nr:hypothetical protein MPER_11083 [Moniliophthora perniciosa FA553]